MIDDIFGELNEGESKKIIGHINDLVVSNGATMLIATSNEKFNKLLGDRVVKIDSGSIID